MTLETVYNYIQGYEGQPTLAFTFVTSGGVLEIAGVQKIAKVESKGYLMIDCASLKVNGVRQEIKKPEVTIEPTLVSAIIRSN